MDDLFLGCSDQPAENKAHRRVTAACSRCRRRKIKCDFKLPSCGACKKASAICKGYDVALKREIPRSIVGYLENRVAELEMELGELRRTLPPEEARDNSYEQVSLGAALASAMLDVVGPNVTHATSWPICSAFYLSPSSLPMPLGRQVGMHQNLVPHPDPADASKDANRTTKPMPLSDVPRAAVDFMIRTYTEHHLPQYPCISETSLLRSYDTCTESPEEATSFEWFVVYIALAISAKTLAWKSEKNAFSASTAFWTLAKEELKDRSCNYTPVNRLQVALLLAHYSLTNPSAANMWYCVGDAARLCIQLGYHREPYPGINVDLVELENRRRLFWTTYGLERALSSYLRLPFSINEDVITTQFPSGLADSCIRPDGLLPGPEKKASALHMWQFRRLETEVFRVLFLQEDLFSHMTLQEWMDDVTVRLNNWHRKATIDFAPEEKLEFRDVQLNFLKGRLHRPTPRNPVPSHASRLYCIDAALQVAQDYSAQKRRGRLYYPWYGVHIVFEAAVVLLDTAWSCSDWLADKADMEAIISGFRAFPKVLMELAALWPAVRYCAEAIEALAEPILNRLQTILMGIDPGPRDEAIQATLTNYLFPDPDLTPTTTMTEVDLANFGEDTSIGIGPEFDWAAGPPIEDVPIPLLFDLDDTLFSTSFSGF